MNKWQWFYDFCEEARRRNDRERAGLFDIVQGVWACQEGEPGEAARRARDGQRTARGLGEPWWVLLFEDLEVGVLLHFQEDYRHLLDPVMRNALKAESPEFAGYPLSDNIRLNVALAYHAVDPPGYAHQIQQLLEHLDDTVPHDDWGTRDYLLRSQAIFRISLGQRPEAEEYCRRALALADNSGTCVNPYTYLYLTWLAWRRDDWPALAGFAEAGEVAARRTSHGRAVGIFLLSQAMVAHHRGERERGRRLRHQAMRQVPRCDQGVNRFLTDALVACHLLDDRPDRALSIRLRQFDQLQNKGRPFRECLCLLQLAEEQRRFGQPVEETAALVRDRALRLRRPVVALDELANVLSGGSVSL